VLKFCTGTSLPERLQFSEVGFIQGRDVLVGRFGIKVTGDAEASDYLEVPEKVSAKTLVGAFEVRSLLTGIKVHSHPNARE